RTELRLSRPAGPSPGAMEFELTTDCVRPSCELVVSSGSDERTFPIASIKVGPLLTSDRLDIAVRQSLGRGASSMFPVASGMRRARLLGVARAVARIWAFVMPALSAVAVPGILFALAMSRTVPPPRGLMTLVAACGAALAARIGLLAYLE